MLTPSFKTGPRRYFLGAGAGNDGAAGLVREPGPLVLEVRSGGGSKVHGNPGEPNQRASATSSTPVKPMSDRRTRNNSVGEVNVASVMVLSSSGVMAASHFLAGAL